MKPNRLKQKLSQGEKVYGPFLKLTDPAVVEIAAYAGFDFVIIDAEHGPISIEKAQNMIRAAEAADIIPIIRVLKNDEGRILQALDIGAQVIEVPQINNKLQAQKLIRAVRFAPYGERGICCYVRAAEYSRINRSKKMKEQYFKTSNDNILIIAHIEGIEGVQNINDIIKEDIDLLFIGPYDLSQSLGLPGQIEDPKVELEMKSIVGKIKNKGKVIGTFADNVEQAKKWVSIGIQFIAFSVDVGLFYEKCRDIVSQLK